MYAQTIVNKRCPQQTISELAVCQMSQSTQRAKNKIKAPEQNTLSHKNDAQLIVATA